VLSARITIAPTEALPVPVPIPSLAAVQEEPDIETFTRRAQKRFLRVTLLVAAVLATALGVAPEWTQPNVATPMLRPPLPEERAPSVSVPPSAAASPTASDPEPAAASPSEPVAIEIDVEVWPPHARLSLDGLDRGSQRLRESVPADRLHELRVAAEGFVPGVYTFRGAPPPRQIRLERLPAVNADDDADDDASEARARRVAAKRLAKRRAARRRAAAARAEREEAEDTSARPPGAPRIESAPARRPKIEVIE
jgi:hypothetical protein